MPTSCQALTLTQKNFSISVDDEEISSQPLIRLGFYEIKMLQTDQSVILTTTF